MSASRDACSLGIRTATLSAWYDHVLPEAEARRLAGHVAGCPACQRRLDRFARITAALQRQPEPDLRARTWRGLQARLARREQQPMRSRAAALSGLGATAAVAAVAVLFVVVLAHRPGSSGPGSGPVAGATATATLAPPACPSFPAGFASQIPNPNYTSTAVYADIPLPPESRIVPNDAAGGVRGYDVCSAGTVASVSAFMSDHLTALGWTAAGGGVWTKNGYSLTLRIPSATDWNISWRDPDQQF